MSRERTWDFGALYEQHSSYVRAIVRRLLRDETDIEDIVHDVFLQAWRQIEQFDPTRGEIRGWLTVIARSRALDQLRRLARRGRYVRCEAAAPAATSDDPYAATEFAQEISRVRGVWDTLPPMTRDILELACIDNLSQREIAARLNQTLGIVKSRMRHGLLVLRGHVLTGAGAHREIEDREQPLTTTEINPHVRGVVALPLLHDLRVMVVDDDAPTRQVLGALLTRAGASPVLRASAADACRTLRDWWPDVLVADINMPGEDGLALIRRVRTMGSRRGRELPSVAFTARATESDRSRILNAGFHVYLSKPVHPIAVLAAIRRVVSSCSPTAA